MAFESIANDSGFILKPGGAMEESLPTDLGQSQYSQSSGITNTGRLIRMPGKRFVQQFGDRVLQIAGFGGAVIIQHGSTIIMYPDACAVSPTDDDDPNAATYAMPTTLQLDVYHANVNSPNPWPNHPPIPRFAPYGVYPAGSYPPPFYADIGPVQSDYTITPKAANRFYRYFSKAAYASAISDANNWHFGANCNDEFSAGTLDLSMYSPSVYANAVLVGSSTSVDKNGQPTPNPALPDNYTCDVTKYLGKSVPGYNLPLPFGAAPLTYYILLDAQNTAIGEFSVDVHSLRLTKFKNKNG